MQAALLLLILAGAAFALKSPPPSHSDAAVIRVMYAFAGPIFLLIIGVPWYSRRRATAQLNAEEQARAAEVWASTTLRLDVTFGGACVYLLLIYHFRRNHCIMLIFVALVVAFVTADELDRFRRARAGQLPESYLRTVRRCSLLYLLTGFIAWTGLVYYL